MPEPIKVDVWSDVACPWCYIGKRKLEAGIAALRQDAEAPQVEVVFHSYELMPGAPVEFEGNAVDFLARSKGMPERQVRQMQDQVAGIAAEVGLDYDFASQQPTNMLKAHQVLQLARARGVQAEVKERLLRAHFVEGRHVGRDADLADLAAEAGLDHDEVLRALEEDAYLPAVRADIDRARQLGITGVPFFLIEGRYGISGAQSPEAFAEALAQARAERQEGSAA